MRKKIQTWQTVICPEAYFGYYYDNNDFLVKLKFTGEIILFFFFILII